MTSSEPELGERLSAQLSLMIDELAVFPPERVPTVAPVLASEDARADERGHGVDGVAGGVGPVGRPMREEEKKRRRPAKNPTGSYGGRSGQDEGRRAAQQDDVMIHDPSSSSIIHHPSSIVNRLIFSPHIMASWDSCSTGGWMDGLSTPSHIMHRGREPSK